MASEIVTSWIQNDVKLSKVIPFPDPQLISSFEIDFANGQLFGELLVFYNLLPDASVFSKKTNKESKIKNFQMVEEVLRQLKVKFDAKLINQIMNEERGAAQRLLYQIKLAVEKQERNQQEMTMTNLRGGVMQNRLQQSKQLAQELMKTGSVDGFPLKTMNQSKKLEIIEKTQLKFEYSKKLLEDKAWADQKKEEELIRKLQQHMRQKNLQVMEENRQFMRDWEKEGKTNWRKNLTKKQEIIDRAKYFEDKEVMAYKTKLNKILDEATRDMSGGIDEYERNLQKLGIEQNTNMQDALKRMEEKKGVPPGQIQNFSYAATMNKIKESKNMTEFAGKERDRRRRKLIVDQAKTQTELEKKKTEEQLIAKLLEKEKTETQIAYLDWRNANCKALAQESRTTKAVQIAETREQQIQQAEQKKKNDQQRIDKQRKEEFELKKREYSHVRRQEKMKKRAVNIEICSEVIDLIMDVADFAFEQQERGNKKLSKPQWRQWMDIFVSNRYVSQVMSDVHMSPHQSLMDEDMGDLGTNMINNKPLEEILHQMCQDQSYQDLMSYFSVSGEFHLASGQLQEWYDLSKWNDPKFSDNPYQNIDFQFLNSFLPPLNEELGRNLQRLFQNLFQVQKSIEESNPQQAFIKEFEGLPHHLPFKISIIGKSYAGKRTKAKMLNDQQFKGKLKIFRMDELIKEVYEYVSPKAQAEVVVDKKAKAPAKGKQEEAPVDPYLGQDTTVYKEIGHAIKKILGEGADLVGQDLTNLIQDDVLLIRLLAAKLKLTFAQDKSEELKVEELKKQILRERELTQQLSEIETANANQPDPKGKKAPAPAKGGKNASNEEVLRQELEEITKIQPEGWILVDFPRTLNQSKQLEKLINNFTCLLDKEKSEAEQEFEQWSKLVTPPPLSLEDLNSKDLQQSVFDAIIYMNVDTQECKRRSQNRKIDPTTNTVYHLEDNPPPENDNKLRDRLQDYSEPECDALRMMRNHDLIQSQEEMMKKWLGGFGLKDESLGEGQAVNSFMEVTVKEKTKKEDVWAELHRQVQNVIKFKQAKLEHKKSEIISQMQLEEVQSRQVIEEQKSATGEETKREFSKQGSRGQVQSRELQSQKTNPERPLLDNFPADSTLRDIWIQFESTYYKDSLFVFKSVRRQREMVFEGFNDLQRRFIEFLDRPSNKQTKVNDFVNSFNRFTSEFPDLREDEQTKEELANRLETLSNDLWAIIENRKDGAIAERKRIMENGWIQHEMKKLIKYAAKIIQGELKKYEIAYQLLIQSNEEYPLDLESMAMYLIETGTSPFTQENSQSPLLMAILKAVFKKINAQFETLNQIEESIQTQALVTAQQGMLFRLNMIKTWVQLKLKEFNQNFGIVCEMLDDWIVEAVSRENDQSQQIVRELRKAIYNENMALDIGAYQVDSADMYQILYINEFQVQDDYQKQLVSVPDPAQDYIVGRFKIADLESLYHQFKLYSYEEYLDSQTFMHVMVLAFQSGRVPEYWRYQGIQKLNNYAQSHLVDPLEKGEESPSIFAASKGFEKKREFINWKHVLTVFALLTCQRESSYSLEEYINEVRSSANEKDEVSKEQFMKTRSFFDEEEMRPEVRKVLTEDDEEDEEDGLVDEGRLERVKELIFNTHKGNTGGLRVSGYQRVIEELGEFDGTYFYELIF